MTDIALVGAGGNMGIRITTSIKDDPAYRLWYVKPAARGRERLHEFGVEPTGEDDAAAAAEAVILAVPDAIIGQVAAGLIPKLRPGTLVITLDPAGNHAGRIPVREDLVYFVTHPTHPPLYDLLAEEDAAARRDYWGGGLARQALVCALEHGPEEAYATGERIARQVFRPISRTHRITVEQMALLEPAMTEAVANTCLALTREALDEVIRRGVPRAAAWDFMMGHLQIGLALFYDALDWKLSAGAQQALDEAREAVINPDWKRLLEPDEVIRSVRRITGGP